MNKDHSMKSRIQIPDKLFFVCFLVFPFLKLQAQFTDLPLNSFVEKYTERTDILDGELSKNCFTDIKPYNRGKAHDLLNLFLNGKYVLSDNDSFNIEYFKNENLFLSGLEVNQRKGIAKAFYRSKRNFFQVDTKDFKLALNPAIQFSGGIEDGRDDMIFVNTRGIELFGSIDQKVGFYTFLTDNQARFPLFIEAYDLKYEVIPGIGFSNTFKDDGFDYYSATGYVDFNMTRHINFQFGHGKNFIGNGYRSLLLSDFATDYFYLKVNTQVWKLHYQNLFTEFVNGEDLSANPYRKKYGAFHYLSFNALKKFRVGLFEGIIFNAEANSRVGYELNYLNPIIFYRSVERDLGSPDNAVIGMNLLCYPFKNVSLYGQVILDEFLLKELRAGNGWWGNKYGLQLGGRYLNMFTISNLDWRFELNTVRPYTYSHEFSGSNYAHFNQTLAHPLGANFKEIVNILDFQFFNRLTTNFRWTYAIYGVDNDTTNWGGDILKSYKTREDNYNNQIAQGYKTVMNSVSLIISFQIMHNTYLDLLGIYRKTNCEFDPFDTKTNIISISFRMNIPYKIQDF